MVHFLSSLDLTFNLNLNLNLARFSNLVSSTSSASPLLSFLHHSAIAVSELGNVDNVILKNIISALSTLFYEAAKNDLGESGLSSFLEDPLHLPGDRIAYLTRVYLAKASELKAVLGSIGYRPSYIQDVHWRLDHVYEGKEPGKVSVPEFTLRFGFEGTNPDANMFQVRCSSEGMQELVAKMKDMVKQAERIVE
eukprot:NODE_3799_length_914_cov_23.910983_g3493_i0.p1 GENE.NODE_3799_length_914_cov_23.910983_g3493_i0~~NODE_3799_length_914_cov_23.910983_g3493_i0.p1  ORF type:complete len:194 (-),score=35.93 NODE_3799_length_914_cov_23.910983_g3493_i0:114-695(-)